MRRSVLYCSHPQEQDKWKVPLALQPCPNPQCRRVGCLIRNGPLRGYGEGSQRMLRGQRVVCSARRSHGEAGCGKSFSMLSGEVLYRRQVSAPQLDEFFSGMLRGLSRRAAWAALGLIFSIRHAYRPASARQKTRLTRAASASFDSSILPCASQGNPNPALGQSRQR